MSIFPIMVKKESGRADSVSGGKEYHLVRVMAENGKSLVINRWGKIGTKGVGFKVERFDDPHEAYRAYKAKWHEKLGKQYSDHFINAETNCKDEAELRKALGPNLFKLKPEDLEYVCPDINTIGVRPHEEGQWIDGKFVEPARRMVVEPSKPEEPIANKIADNPNWGLF